MGVGSKKLNASFFLNLGNKQTKMLTLVHSESVFLVQYYFLHLSLCFLVSSKSVSITYIGA